MVDPADALRGRDRELPVAPRHEVLGTPLKPPFPAGMEQAIVAIGCFWTTEDQRVAAEASRDAYAERLREAGYPDITTEITTAGPFYYAEDYHQQYLAKNPWGYCGLAGTGVSCPVGIAMAGKAS
jgi:peptide methionine sulfoxide reductase MsrA